MTRARSKISDDMYSCKQTLMIVSRMHTYDRAVQLQDLIQACEQLMSTYQDSETWRWLSDQWDSYNKRYESHTQTVGYVEDDICEIPL